MQLEFHCPRRNRIAPNIISLKLEAGSSTLKGTVPGFQKWEGM